MHTVFDGVMFINNANLASKNRAPSGRIDENYLETVKGKLNQALQIAKENKLRIIFTGNLFKNKFDVSAVSTFLELFGDEKPLILASQNGKPCEIDPESSLGILKSAKAAFIASSTGKAESFYIEGELDTYELNIFNQLSGDSIDAIDFVDGMGFSDEKTLIISSDYQETEEEITGSHGLLCCKWASIGKPEQGAYKFYAGDLVRDNPKIESVSVTAWTEKQGFHSIEIEHDSVVFEDEVIAESLSNSSSSNVIPCSEFAKKLKEAAENKSDKSQVSTLIEQVSETMNISTGANSIIQNIYKEVTQ
ncbi:hypothetical protein [Vibrio owensii]|uniref:hypothetical protein n=1 Tax=Vibrio harveyi group TaxID=717610 RepID=UPI003CC691D1